MTSLFEANPTADHSETANAATKFNPSPETLARIEAAAERLQYHLSSPSSD